MEEEGTWGGCRTAVYNAPDEDTAIHVRALLWGAGIEAEIRSAQVPCFDGAMTSGIGYWGQVMVREADERGARELLREFGEGVGEGQSC